MDADALELPAGSPLASNLTAEWTAVPLRIPTGWTVHWNTLHARRLATGLYEVNSSEDLLWCAYREPPWYRPDVDGPWNVVQVDAGWYHDRFRVDLLDSHHDWDDRLATRETRCLAELVDIVESWLTQPPGSTR